MAGQSSSGLLLVGVLCVLAATHVLALYEHTCTLEDRQEVNPAGVCGSRLAELVDIVCRMQGGYVQKWYHKRSETGTLSSERLKDVILGKEAASSYLRRRRTVYGEQGITCECCFNQCNFKELSQYCRHSAGRR